MGDTMNKRKIILDVDTGTDDAIALMAAILSDAFEIVGVTTVAGNLPLPQTTANTLRVVSLLAPHIPVIRGCAQPLVRDLDPRRKFCDNEETVVDETGHRIAFHVEEFASLPPATLQPSGQNAVCWLVETIKNSPEKITLILVGPQTNFATALRADESIVTNIEQIVIMGGGFDERNSSSSAEFNFFMDPEAAQIVLNCGADITLIPLDATHHAVLSMEDVQEMRSWNTVVGNFVADITEERIKAYNTFQPLFKPDSASMHDALCVLYLLNPAVITKSELFRVDVVTGGGVCDGQSIIDARPTAKKRKNCLVCLRTDDELFSRMLLDLLRRANF
ncbi:nucleoside hydrolase [Candidatus Allofournierella excrementavium]|uniref:nucleoside hydrolase n=1 Tax=Candidatus Allofournierella excrementavium TaxID=2838591 RepID=UPI003AF61850